MIAVSAGLVIAQLMMTGFSFEKGFIQGFLWFNTFDYRLNIAIGIIIMLLCGYFFGQISGVQILIQQRNYLLTGVCCGLAVLLITAFLASWTGFFQEGIKRLGTNDNPFEDYILKPVVWIFSFGFIPAIAVGIWFGASIRRRAQ